MIESRKRLNIFLLIKAKHGAAGVSGASTELWHKMVSNFKDTSSELCSALAIAAERIATEFIHPDELSVFLANRGLPFDKCPGLRPIGIGEVLRRIIGKTILKVCRSEITRAAGSIQLCAGQSAGVEAAIYALKAMFEADEHDGILLIDASNSFNELNCKILSWDIQVSNPVLKYT